MNCLLFCAINSKKIACETVYSILSLFKISNNYLNNCKIFIVTNFTKESYAILEKYSNIEIVQITDEMVAEWIGKEKNIYRVKIKAIELIIEKYDTNVLFIDSDTFFMKEIDYLFEIVNNKNFVMNFKCNNIYDIVKIYQSNALSEYSHFAQKIINFYMGLYNNNGIYSITKPNKKYILPPNFVSYNSGAIGINKKFKNLLLKIDDIAKSMYNTYNYENAEEVAFSYAFQMTRKIIYTCEDAFYHYSTLEPVRALLGNCLGYFHLDDNIYFNEIIIKYNLNIEVIKKLEIKDIPYFVSYLLDEMPIPSFSDALFFHGKMNHYYRESPSDPQKTFSDAKKVFKLMYKGNNK